MVEDHQVDPFTAGQPIEVAEDLQGVVRFVAGPEPDRDIKIPRIGGWVQDAASLDEQVQIVTVAECDEGALGGSFAQALVR